MDPTIQQWRFQVGDEVCSADDHKLGKVVAVQPDCGAADPPGGGEGAAAQARPDRAG